MAGLGPRDGLSSLGRENGFPVTLGLVASPWYCGDTLLSFPVEQAERKTCLCNKPWVVADAEVSTGLA